MNNLNEVEYEFITKGMFPESHVPEVVPSPKFTFQEEN